MISPAYDRGLTEWNKPASRWERGLIVDGMIGRVGFALTVVYVFATIISPDQFGSAWANYHALTFLGGAIFLLSLPGLVIDARLTSSVQMFLLIGFTLAMGISEVANGWVGGAIKSWQLFLPSAIVFFFVVANVTTARRLKSLVLVSVASCLVVVVEALCGYYGGFRGRTFILTQTVFGPGGGAGHFVRVRGAGFLSDPNDFAQMLLIVLPLTSIAWQRGRFVVNSLTVLAPAALLLWTIYLTHSRGALIALAIIGMIAIRKRMGTTASVVLTALGTLGMLALNFTGGRLISADAGADRLWLWASGLEMFKSAPLFGVGFGRFADIADLTAHNSFVLCLAELGFVGSTFWVALLVTTMMGLNGIINVREKRQTEPACTEEDMPRNERATFLRPVPFSCKSRAVTSIATSATMDIPTGDEHALQSQLPTEWIAAMRLAVVSFIATGWFLSRTYQSTMYLVVGLATATIALNRYGDEPPARVRWLPYTVAVEVAVIIFIDLVVRLRF